MHSLTFKQPYDLSRFEVEVQSELDVAHCECMSVNERRTGMFDVDEWSLERRSNWR